MAIKTIELNDLKARIGLIATLVVCLVIVVFFAKWCFANAIATRVDLQEVAAFTTDLAPNDPQTHYALAVLNEKSFQLDDLKTSLAEFETATALSPNDFRLWLALGKSRGQNGDAEGAEKAFRKALELAPSYAMIHWTLGNNLVRQNKTEAGFAEIRIAAESDAKYIKPAVSTAWVIFDGDLGQIKKYIGDSVQINAELAVFLAGQGQFDEALEVWNKLPEEEKKTTYKENGENLFRAMIMAKRYRNALQIEKQISPPETQNSEPETIFNGGFETDVTTQNAGIFDWQLGEQIQPQILLDQSQKHNGNRSLVIVFNSTTGKEFRQLSQIVVVEPGKSYEFEAFYKSELKAPLTIKWNIIDISTGSVLASTAAISEKTDWTKLKVDFKTADETQAVMIQLVRETCNSTICPISGKVWFDDFALKY